MIRKVYLAFLLLCVLDFQRSYAVGITKQEREQNILKQLLSTDKYNRKVRPAGHKETGPTVIAVSFNIRRINIDEIKKEFGVELTFRQQWQDSRLAYNTTNNLSYLVLTERSQIWIPDLFLSYDKTSHLQELMVPNYNIRIYPNGDVLYNSRITMQLNCLMDLKLFPHDEQACSLRMASYAYATEDIVFTFKTIDPVQVTSNMQLPKFTLKEFVTANCDASNNAGTYSCLRVDLTFLREFSPYLINTYIPSTMIVIVAWMGSWLDQNCVTARILIGLSTLFVLSTQVSELNASLPTTGYTKAIDMWTGISLTFVLACLMEFIIVHYLSRAETGEEKKIIEKPQENANAEEMPLNQGQQEEIKEQEPKKKIRKAAENWFSRFPTKSRKVDAIFRITFPTVYSLFVIIYFLCY